MKSIALRISEELGVREAQVSAAVELMDGGSTVPFIARYRKEATGALDDTQLRNLEERLGYLRELEDRRAAILRSIEEQGKLSAELAGQINTSMPDHVLAELGSALGARFRKSVNGARILLLGIAITVLILAIPQRAAGRTFAHAV